MVECNARICRVPTPTSCIELNNKTKLLTNIKEPIDNVKMARRIKRRLKKIYMTPPVITDQGMMIALPKCPHCHLAHMETVSDTSYRLRCVDCKYTLCVESTKLEELLKLQNAAEMWKYTRFTRSHAQKHAYNGDIMVNTCTFASKL